MKKKHHQKTSRLPQILALAGVTFLVVAVLLLKPEPQEASPAVSANESAEVQLDRALAENRPTLAFFHSNNCQQCIDMIGIVAQVYPEFSEMVTLVDINVYDERNAELLNRVSLQYIPTLIFYDQTGQGRVSVGVMEAEVLRQTLAALAAGK